MTTVPKTDVLITEIKSDDDKSPEAVSTEDEIAESKTIVADMTTVPKTDVVNY